MFLVLRREGVVLGWVRRAHRNSIALARSVTRSHAADNDPLEQLRPADLLFSRRSVAVEPRRPLSTVVEMTAGANEIADQGETADFQRSRPMKRMGAGAVIRDADGNVLIVKPTYKPGWELPGGAVEDDESPAEACTREIREELGVDLTVGALMCVDYNSSTSGYVESLMFLFDIELLDTGTVSEIRLDENELSECRFVSLDEATELLDARVARRLDAVLRPVSSSVYLEDQHPPG